MSSIFKLTTLTPQSMFFHGFSLALNNQAGRVKVRRHELNKIRTIS